MELEKKYVPVTVHFDANGKMRPIEIEFDEMRRYHIDTNEHVNNCQYVQMALESLPKDKEVHQMRVEYKKSAVYGDMIYPRIAAEDDRTVVELCDENAKPYAVIEFRFA